MRNVGGDCVNLREEVQGNENVHWNCVNGFDSRHAVVMKVLVMLDFR